MKPFMNQDFLLETDTARALFHDYAAAMPIIDYHCHLSPREIAENRGFETITQVWLSGDHYKWRQMRTNGVPEAYITGDKPDIEKFRMWAATLQKAIGNPLYHWSHLELQRYFGIEEPLTPDNADDIYARCNQQLVNGTMRARDLMLRAGVETVCTTDDPADSLEWHTAIAADTSFSVRVLPAWRPDRAVDIEKPDFIDYLKTLSAAAELPIHNFADVKRALATRMTYFAERGCRVSDHGLSFVPYRPATEAELEVIFAKRTANQPITEEEVLTYKTALLLFCAQEYSRLGWVMQLHYGVRRSNNTRMLQRIGVDTGFDCIGDSAPLSELISFLDALCAADALPKTVLYSLNPTDNAAIGSIIGCFQDESAVGKIQHGSAWWFNDHKDGIREQLRSLASFSLLPNFIGMLTDSRSFLSYPRHEYFRRILCNLLGDLVENGEYPADMAFLGKTVSDISYYNCKRYFGF